MSSTPMSSLITTINKLQDAFTILGYDPLSLPQICVVGGQSSGKSSVLENIVGRDFLPRGSGIVTRRPLVIQLIASPNLGQDYGVFLHKGDNQYTNFDEIRKEIERATDDETGSNKGISEKPINLKIFSRNVVNLTLVDLPGITRVAVGDQPKDIEQIIRRMVLRFISAKNAIILAVTAANTDLANSDALQMAREVDPEGYRTVGVITKLDIMDRGTHALDVLQGDVIPLRLGYIGVVNRAQADIDSNKRIEDQWRAEAEFFNSHPEYKRIADRCGTPYLTKTLNRTLIQHIRSCLPEIVGKLTTFLQERNKELAELMELGDGGAKGRIILRALTTFSDEFRRLLEGNADDISSTELHGGARIANIFRATFATKVNSIDIKDTFSYRELRTTIQNCLGLRGGLFIPDSSFEVLVRKAIRSLEKPCKDCVSQVHEELAVIINNILTPEMKRFNALRGRIQDTARELLLNCVQPTAEFIGTLVEMEASRINTDHPDFLGSGNAVAEIVSEVSNELAMNNNAFRDPTPKAPARHRHVQQHPPSLPPAPSSSPAQRSAPPPPPVATKPKLSVPGPPAADDDMSDRERIEAEVIRRLLDSYFSLVRTKLVDSIPKAISLLLINKVTTEMHDTLVSQLYRESLFDKLLEESEQIKVRREKCKEVVGLLEQSLQVISSIQANDL